MAKPRPPELDLARLEEFRKASTPIDSLAARLRQFEDLRASGEEPATYFALELFAELAFARRAGYPDDILKKAFPAEWGEATAQVPLSMLLAFAQGWMKYKQSGAGVTLGEAMKIEGGGQGKTSAKSRMATRDHHRDLANAVVSVRIACAKTGNPISLESAKEKIASERGVSVDTVENAYKKYGKDAENGLADVGVIEKWVKSSRTSSPE